MTRFVTCFLVLPGVLAAGGAAAQSTHAARDLSAGCFTCHGTGGNSVQDVPPSLAGRDRRELFRMLKDFQSGKRPSTIMQQQARGYSDQQLQLIAAFISGLEPESARLPPRSPN
jgi:cytochrome c553